MHPLRSSLAEKAAVCPTFRAANVGHVLGLFYRSIRRKTAPIMFYFSFPQECAYQAQYFGLGCSIPGLLQVSHNEVEVHRVTRI